MFPKIQMNGKVLAKSDAYFGSGGKAYREIFFAKKVVEYIVKNKYKGFGFHPASAWGKQQ